MRNKQTVLVTGGAGYIGSHCLVEVLNSGYDVITIDNLHNSRSASLRRVEEITGKKVIFYLCDLKNQELLDKIFCKHKIDFVIHFAGSKNVGESVKDPLSYFKNNLISSINLFETMINHGVFQLVFSSSSSVYGEAKVFPIPETHPTGNVISPYARTKYMIEEFLKDLSASDKRWNIICLRYFNPIGAHPSGKIGEDGTNNCSNIVPLIARVAIGIQPKLPIFGIDYETRDGTAIRDYTHVMDLVEGHVLALEKLKNIHANFKVYNLGLGGGLTVLELVKQFEKTSGKKIVLDIQGRRPGDVTRMMCDASLASKELNWVPKRNVQNMCDDYWRWQQLNPNGYQDQSTFPSQTI